jgi:hypothetical protein
VEGYGSQKEKSGLLPAAVLNSSGIGLQPARAGRRFAYASSGTMRDTDGAAEKVLR